MTGGCIATAASSSFARGSIDVDPLAQRVTVEMRASLWRDDELVAEE